MKIKTYMVCGILSCSLESKEINNEINILEKIITSATGFDLPLKDEAKNVIIIDKQDLQNKGYVSLEQALEKQPSISFIARPNGTKEIDIRGQGLDSTKAVKILLNRIPLNLQDTGNGGHNAGGVTPFNHISINDIESIEIIPGGGSVIYGNGTRGGVINIVTKKPSKDYMRFNAHINSYESFNTLGTNLGASVGRNIGDIFIFGNLDYRYQNGLRDREYTQNLYTALGGIYHINENQKLDINLSYSRMWRFFGGYHSILNNGVLKSKTQMKDERYKIPNANNANGYVTQDFITASLNYRYNINENFEIDSILYYQFSNFLFPDISLENSNFVNHNTGLNLKAKYINGKNKLIFGLDNIFEASDNLSKSSFSNLQNKGSKYSLALYALDSYQITDRFSISGGARGEFSYFSIMGHTGISFGSLNGYFDINASKPQFSYALEITPSFNYTDTGSIYAKAEAGFISLSIRQAVSTDPNFNTTSTGVGPKIASDIKPEQYFTAEIGIRDEFDFAFLQATLFYTHTLNEIRYNLYGFRTEYYNLGQTQRFGIELQSKQSFYIFNFTQSLSYLYSNVLKGRESALMSGTSSTSGNFEGKPIPYVPLMKITLEIEAELINRGNERLNVWLLNSYYASMVDNNQLTINKGGYLLSNLGFTYKYNNLSISGGIRNIFDSFYISYQNTTIRNGNLTNGIYLAGEGRSYFLEGRVEF